MDVENFREQSAMTRRKYDSTVARMAGNIAGTIVDRVLREHPEAALDIKKIVTVSVRIARELVAEVVRTESEAP